MESSKSANDNNAEHPAASWPLRVEDALRANPGTLADAHLQLRCHCGYWGATTIGFMARKYGHAETIGGLIGRYRCRTCRGYPSLIVMSDRALGWEVNITSIIGTRVLVLHSLAQVDREQQGIIKGPIGADVKIIDQ